MKLIVRFLVLVVLILFFVPLKQTFGGTKPVQVGRKVEDFSLKNVDDKIISLSNYPLAKGFVIIFTCNHCPFANLYPSRFNELALEYGIKNVPLIAINGMDSVTYEDETISAMKKKAEENKFVFPYLQDAAQTVTRQFQAERTPQAFIIWKENNDWLIKYTGAIDDNGSEPDKAKNKYIKKALDELLSNKPVLVSETASIGCAIYLRK